MIGTVSSEPLSWQPLPHDTADPAPLAQFSNFDSETRTTSLAGVHCLAARNAFGAPQIYFRIERPHALANRAVEIAVEVFGDVPYRIWVEYDSTDQSVVVAPNAPGAFKRTACAEVRPTQDWARLRFEIDDGRFRGNVNGGDFRIVSDRTGPAPLLLRRIELRSRAGSAPEELSASAGAPASALRHYVEVGESHGDVGALAFPVCADPDVSIIVPVYNRVALTLQCLDAVRRNTDGLYEVIVVDNGSTDGTAEALRAIPNLRVVAHRQNLAFAGGSNSGAAAARASFLLFLNNDTIPAVDWLSAMRRCIDEDSSVAVVGSRLVFPDTGEIQHAGIALYEDRLPYHPFKFSSADDRRVAADRYVDAVTGACLLTRKDIFDRCGGFDVRYVNGYEDVDFCLRVRKRGYRILYCASSVLVHYESQTRNAVVPDRESENRRLFVERWKANIPL